MAVGARSFHPRAGFFAGVLFSVWLPPRSPCRTWPTVLEPSVQSEYGVNIPWWIWVLAGLAMVIYFAYQGITISGKALIITGLIEIVIMVGLAIIALASPGPGGFSLTPLNPANFGTAGNLFLGVVFSIFAFSGWVSNGPRSACRSSRSCACSSSGSQRVLLLGERDHHRLVSMYILCNIEVVRYYLTEGRAQFNPLLHLTVPAVATAAGILVVWKSYFSPFTSTGPVY